MNTSDEIKRIYPFKHWCQFATIERVPRGDLSLEYDKTIGRVGYLKLFNDTEIMDVTNNNNNKKNILSHVKKILFNKLNSLVTDHFSRKVYHDVSIGRFCSELDQVFYGGVFCPDGYQRYLRDCYLLQPDFSFMHTDTELINKQRELKVKEKALENADFGVDGKRREFVKKNDDFCALLKKVLAITKMKKPLEAETTLQPFWLLLNLDPVQVDNLISSLRRIVEVVEVEAELNKWLNDVERSKESYEKWDINKDTLRSVLSKIREFILVFQFAYTLPPNFLKMDQLSVNETQQREFLEYVGGEIGAANKRRLLRDIQLRIDSYTNKTFVEWFDDVVKSQNAYITEYDKAAAIEDEISTLKLHLNHLNEQQSLKEKINNFIIGTFIPRMINHYKDHFLLQKILPHVNSLVLAE